MYSRATIVSFQEGLPSSNSLKGFITMLALRFAWATHAFDEITMTLAFKPELLQNRYDSSFR
jgi:hypothetical protein